MRDYKCSNVQSQPSQSSSTKTSTIYSISNYLSSQKLCSPYSKFISNISSIVEPRYFFEAIKDPKWKAAINSKLQALEANKTWSIVDLPPGKSLVGCKWVFKVKYKSDGFVELYKAGLVVKGYT